MSGSPYAVSIYKSSAGSGKTFTLVREYLRIVLAEPAEYPHILAITFTNKAAGEMKERILSALGRLARNQAPEISKLITAEDGIAEAEIPIRAAAARSAILHDYMNFNVCTIDAFTHRIVRNFAHDLNLPSQFDVETDQVALTARMVGLLMELIGREPYITHMLIQFVQERLAQESHWNLDHSLARTAAKLFDEESARPIEQLHQLNEEQFPAFIAFIKERRDHYLTGVKTLAAECLAMIAAAGLRVNDFSGGKDSGASVFQKVQASLSPEEYEKYLNSGRFLAAVKEDRWFAGKGHAQIEALLDRGLRDKAQELHAFHLQHFPAFLTAWYAYANIHGLAVIKRIEAITADYKEKNNVLLIGDFQRKVASFITQESPDYLYWRLGERYRHFLVDEFQDTSEVQWTNLTPLFDHLLSGGHEKGSVLLVGDSRQAIYRWRGGNLSLLETTAPQHLDAQSLRLDTNFRSREAIVAFNNQFFEQLAQVLAPFEEVGRIYDSVAQKVRPGNEGGGYVRVEIIDNAAGFKDQCLARTVEIIEELRRDGFELSDIAILVRNREEGARLADGLVQQGITVISSDSLLLHKNPQVAFLIHLMRLIAAPGDRITRTAIEVYLKQAAGRDPGEEVEGLLPPLYLSLLKNPGRLSLYELAEDLIRTFQLQQTAPAFLQRFLDAVLEFSQRALPDLPGFLDWWEEKKGGLSLVVPQGENAVEILTIHKAKGLQYPVVIMPFVNWNIRPHVEHDFWGRDLSAEGDWPDTFLLPSREALSQSAFSPAWKAELAATVMDNVNLLYVAFTRAENRMYLLVPASLKKEPDPEKPTTASDLVRCVLQSPLFDSPDKMVYEAGLPIPQLNKKRAAASPLPGFLSASWRDRIRIERASRKLWDEAGSDTAPHLLLREALVQLDSAAQLGQVLSRMVQSGWIQEGDAPRLAAEWKSLLDQPPLADWFAEGLEVQRRPAFASPNGEIWFPDRLIRRGDEVLLIQFTHEKEKKEARKLLTETAKALGGNVQCWLFLCDRMNAERI